MTRSVSPLEFSSFTKGLRTDGSPLNQEPDSAREMSNFDLDIDGTIKRRKGLTKLSPSYQLPETGSVESVLTAPVASYDNYKDVVAQQAQQYWWRGIGPAEDVDLSVTLVGGSMTFQKIGGTSLEGVVVTDGETTSKDMSFPQPTDRTISLPITQVGKKLVVGQPNVAFTVLEYVDGQVSVSATHNITVRDLWGVSLIANNGEDYSAGNNVNKRPDFGEFPNSSINYIYNLRNQGFNTARWRPTNSTAGALDPLAIWLLDGKAGSYPSMTDSVSKYLYPDTSLTEATRDRYHAADSFADSPVSTRAVRGAHLIELGNRLATRKQAFIDAEALSPYEGFWTGLDSIEDLDSDDSSDQEMPRAMGEYSGRLWFGGFSGTSSSPHSESPDLSNLLFFSQLNTSEANLFKCHQEGDPTSKESPDLVATDGGFVSILGMSGCGKLVEFGNSLVVFAKTGVWSIVGTDAGGFSATGYEVKKLSSTGTGLFNSITLAGDTITYLAGDGVYAVQVDEAGQLKAGKVTQGALDNLFNSFSSSQLHTSVGAYSEGEREVRWVMHDETGAKELKFKMELGAFSVNDYVGDLFNGGAAIPVGILPLGDSSGDFLYLIAQRGSVSTEMQYGFSTQEDSTFSDFSSFNIPADSNWAPVTGSDAKGSLLMSHYTGGDTMRNKGVTYLTMMFNKTETGFDDEWEPVGASSCLVQAQWDWANSSAGGKFGRQFQAYRHRRLFLSDSQASFDDGNEVVVSKNKLRGKGKALSLKFETEPNLDCHILGWSMNMSIGNAV